MRKALAILALLAAALLGAPATALAAPTATLQLAAWVQANTDLAVSQVAIAGPENVYSLEPLGPRLPTGEVLALVRTEAVSDGWRDAHQFQSWDAHMLFDCLGGRVRVLRSASYSERDRAGPARADERGDAWFSPQPQTPAATLLAATCDPDFSWPLRGSPATAPSKAAPLGGPAILQKAQAPSPRISGPMTQVLVQTAVQIARTPAVRLAEVQPNEHMLPAAAEAPKPVLIVATVQPETASSPEVAQFASKAPAEITSLQAQKASFIAAPVLERAPESSQEALPARQPAGVLAAAAAATRSWRRLAGAGRTWLVRRVDLAVHHGEAPPHPDRALVQLAQAS